LKGHESSPSEANDSFAAYDNGDAIANLDERRVRIVRIGEFFASIIAEPDLRLPPFT
jgi:hypothetical protein